MTAKATKNFDCVAFQRAQREEIGKDLEGMSSEELGAWMHDYRPADPKLRRLVERPRNRAASVQNAPSPHHRPPSMSYRATYWRSN